MRGRREALIVEDQQSKLTDLCGPQRMSERSCRVGNTRGAWDWTHGGDCIAPGANVTGPSGLWTLERGGPTRGRAIGAPRAAEVSVGRASVVVSCLGSSQYFPSELYIFSRVARRVV